MDIRSNNERRKDCVKLINAAILALSKAAMHLQFEDGSSLTGVVALADCVDELADLRDSFQEHIANNWE